MVALTLFALCSILGCPVDAGGGCTPDTSDCRGDYYCAIGGVCTKVCEADVECVATCETAQNCGGTTAEKTWTCEMGACACSGPECPNVVKCYGGYCQRECAANGGCAYTPYKRRTR